MSRFSQPQDPDFQAINASLDFDWRLWRHDVAQSRAHAAMLASIAVITEQERDELEDEREVRDDEVAAGRVADSQHRRTYADFQSEKTKRIAKAKLMKYMASHKATTMKN